MLNVKQRSGELLDMHILKRARERMVETHINSIPKDEELKSTWIKSFQDDTTKDKVMDGHTFHR